MIVHRISLSEEATDRISDIVKRLSDSDEREIDSIIRTAVDKAKIDKKNMDRLEELQNRRKYITRNNMAMVLILRGLESEWYKEDYEETIDQLVHFGLAKGRPDGK